MKVITIFSMKMKNIKLLKDSIISSGLAAHTCSHSTWRVKQEEQEFKASLGYMMKHCLN